MQETIEDLPIRWSIRLENGLRFYLTVDGGCCNPDADSDTRQLERRLSRNAGHEYLKALLEFGKANNFKASPAQADAADAKIGPPACPVEDAETEKHETEDPAL